MDRRTQHLNKIVTEILRTQRIRGDFFIQDNPDFQLLPLMQLFDTIPVDEHGHTVADLKSYIQEQKKLLKTEHVIVDSLLKK